MSTRIRIGIDPGKTTGVAVLVNGKLEALHSESFWDISRQLEVSSRDKYTDHHVYIEDPNLTSPTWHKGMSQRARDKASQRVGMVMREASLLCELMDELGIKYTRCKPLRDAKWDHKMFQRAFPEWNGQTNEHTRDAARLVAGR